MKTKKIIYSGLARFFIGLFSIFLIVDFIIEFNYQLSRGEFRSSLLSVGFLGFIFVYATIIGSTPFGFFEPPSDNEK